MEGDRGLWPIGATRLARNVPHPAPVLAHTARGHAWQLTASDAGLLSAVNSPAARSCWWQFARPAPAAYARGGERLGAPARRESVTRPADMARAPAVWLRDIFACLVIWLGEPARRVIRSASCRVARLATRSESTTPGDVHVPPPPFPHRPLHWQGERPVDGEAVALVRPYVLAQERGQQAPLGSSRSCGSAYPPH